MGTKDSEIGQGHQGAALNGRSGVDAASGNGALAGELERSLAEIWQRLLRVDPARVFAIAKKAGYRGYFSMEWEGRGDPYDGTKRLLQQSLENLS